jgi:hypothetical protein
VCVADGVEPVGALDESEGSADGGVDAASVFVGCGAGELDTGSEGGALSVGGAAVDDTGGSTVEGIDDAPVVGSVA